MLYKLSHIRYMKPQSSIFTFEGSVEIEREELRRERYGEAPLTKDEIAEISDKHVLNEIRKGKR